MRRSTPLSGGLSADPVGARAFATGFNKRHCLPPVPSQRNTRAETSFFTLASRNPP
jgi:hypothetical protein